MKYGANAYFNLNPAAMNPWRGYKEGDVLRASVMVTFPEGATPSEAADVVFRLMNMDERPNGQTERSLSVGDIVRIVHVHPEGTGESITWLACASRGWEEVRPPAPTKIAKVATIEIGEVNL